MLCTYRNYWIYLYLNIFNFNFHCHDPDKISCLAVLYLCIGLFPYSRFPGFLWTIRKSKKRCYQTRQKILLRWNVVNISHQIFLKRCTYQMHIWQLNSKATSCSQLQWLSLLDLAWHILSSMCLLTLAQHLFSSVQTINIIYLRNIFSRFFIYATFFLPVLQVLKLCLEQAMMALHEMSVLNGFNVASWC